jgi:hypothetical protein
MLDGAATLQVTRVCLSDCVLLALALALALSLSGPLALPVLSPPIWMPLSVCLSVCLSLSGARALLELAATAWALMTTAPVLLALPASGAPSPNRHLHNHLQLGHNWWGRADRQGRARGAAGRPGPVRVAGAVRGARAWNRCPRTVLGV